MKNKIHILFLLAIISFQSIQGQETKINLLKIENYTKGDLEIKVVPFGLDSPITIGNITDDGIIHFDFPETHISTTNDNPFYSVQKIGRSVGMFVCHDKVVEEHTETITAIEIKDIFLYKYGQRVGALFAATQNDMLENKFSLGSKLSWFISSGEGVFKATCITYEDDGLGKGGLDKNNLANQTSYDVKFKKGWNTVEHKLIKTKVLEDDRGQYKRRLIEEKTSIAKIPSTMNWYIKYWANDELLEIEQQLANQTPTTKEQFENWIPKKIGDLKRTNYEIGKTLKRMPTLNNIELLFEKGNKKSTVTIVDCSNNKKAASVYTLIKDMVSRDWRDETNTGYSSATKIDNTRVMIDYNEKETKTTLSYIAFGRFIIKAEASNIEPEVLWETLKTLQIKELIKN